MCASADKEVYLKLLLAELRAAWAQYRARRQAPQRSYAGSRPTAPAR